MTPPRSSGSTSLLLLAVIAALLLVASSLPAPASAQQIRIPLTRMDVREGHHPTRSPQRISNALRVAEKKDNEQAKSFNLFSRRHTHSALQLAVDSSRRVSLRNYFNRMYTGVVAVGTPSNEYRLVFDTGSADMSVHEGTARRDADAVAGASEGMDDGSQPAPQPLAHSTPLRFSLCPLSRLVQVGVR